MDTKGCKYRHGATCAYDRDGAWSYPLTCLVDPTQCQYMRDDPQRAEIARLRENNERLTAALAVHREAVLASFVTYEDHDECGDCRARDVDISDATDHEAGCRIGRALADPTGTAALERVRAMEARIAELEQQLSDRKVAHSDMAEMYHRAVIERDQAIRERREGVNVCVDVAGEALTKMLAERDVALARVAGLEQLVAHMDAQRLNVAASTDEREENYAAGFRQLVAERDAAIALVAGMRTRVAQFASLAGIKLGIDCPHRSGDNKCDQPWGHAPCDPYATMCDDEPEYD